MSKLKELIDKYCPNGVEYKRSNKTKNNSINSDNKKCRISSKSII